MYPIYQFPVWLLWSLTSFSFYPLVEDPYMQVYTQCFLFWLFHNNRGEISLYTFIEYLVLHVWYFFLSIIYIIILLTVVHVGRTEKVQFARVCSRCIYMCNSGWVFDIDRYPGTKFWMCCVWTFAGEDSVCQCSEWPVCNGGVPVWQHVDATGCQWELQLQWETDCHSHDDTGILWWEWYEAIV